ncbi:WD40 repeat-like protein [Periconia macrospinosa]|uniref:WD40 repeat-like protein n=1 Tax=Periconia macrospinosa TaxID=97972 RepID=A0A2V1DJL8_9PLEO|nr:WD40 repeat-like protein [Periconia macrospinosa]
MKSTIFDRLLKREIASDRSRYPGVPGLYGDRKWVHELDIVNELEGHTGCVNALCWSTSGRLLASGSDDHRINIHSYHPDSSTSQFNLTTSIVTGHSSNIFSVKFMPYSNDRTIVSATDDVRIFDIEHSGHSALRGTSSRRSNGARYRVGIQGIPDGITLTQGDTNAKAFKCHSDTVKRIVTEDNPFYFLTCSEDGDVRQWDIRQPAKTYPQPRDAMLPSWAAEGSDNIPPPLISYARYHLDLNTVSCSPSQPHYIALGGAHLHCFLHDRRMLGRDKLAERGMKLSSPEHWSDHDEELFNSATQCVKKFAKNGKQRMRRTDNGHITACKISDANPNELVVSWSGDHVYSFDIQRAPDASEDYVEAKSSSSSSGRRSKDQSRKRKRPKSGSLNREEVDRTSSRQRTESSDDGLALRVNYGNGQSEEIQIEVPQSFHSQDELAAIRDTDHFRIASSLAKLREIFHLAETCDMDDPKSYQSRLTGIMGRTAAILPDMDEVSRSWRYPVDPSPVDVALQNKLRDTRSTYRRFVQATGTLARVLGGQLQTPGDSQGTIAQYFTVIQPAPNERALPRHEHFAYDFLKAILLWLDSGVGALIDGFSSRNVTYRLPIPADADLDAIDDILIPHLLQLASDDRVVDVDANRFETDDNRVLFSSEKAAVIAFSRALKIPFADLTGTDRSLDDEAEEEPTQDRAAAVRRWALKVGRGVLLNASRNLRFFTIDRAYGGRGIGDPSIQASEREHRQSQTDVHLPESNDVEEYEALVNEAWARNAAAQEDIASSSRALAEEDLPTQTEIDVDHEAEAEDNEDNDESESDEVNDNEESDGDLDPSDPEGYEDDDDDVEEPGLTRTQSGRILWRSDFDRSYLRERVEANVPCAPHTRVYSGHCNIRTVKDVNFFGQQDEYVVSGSDCGHLFIWDRKTAQLVNILEGDGEVVNVIQGHPYEPTMAVSGIDHTIKIFSPDANEQRNARKGIGVQRADPSLSNIHFGRRRRQRQDSPTPPPRDPTMSEEEDDEIAANGLKSRKAMHKSYEIISENDMTRRGGGEDAFITRALLSQLAQRLHAYPNAGIGVDDNGQPALVLNNDDGCNVM